MDRHPFTEEALAEEADRLLAATLHLMARHAANPCPQLARMIERHLAAVASHAGCGSLVREVGRLSRAEWGRLRADCPLGYAAPPCEKRSMRPAADD